jgi:CubicO group peptidase (beta-lactamase class C family)
MTFPPRRQRVFACFIAAALSGVLAAAAGATAFRDQAAAVPASPAQVDALFAEYSRTTPGCAVGVAAGGRPVLTRAYGMADLEHDAPNAPDTIFEAGSVSKQFTAAAVLLLASDGKVDLDAPVRTYVPELPDYGEPLTVRHLLSHTSGLRDWGSVAGISGWPRTTRVHTHAHVLDILRRQRALNFSPGTRWSYSNSGYNLSAIIVSRAAGVSFAEFSRRRIFEPLGMTRTSWRDDYTAVVRNRAIAYSGQTGNVRQDMPFENVHGNGGLLTTVGDLLAWNEHLSSPGPEWRVVVDQMQLPARLADGRALHYGLGLFVEPFRGRREIYHSGSTAGYRAFLTRFPDDRVSVAVLCNAAGANATQLAHGVAELYLDARPATGPARPPRLAEAAGPTAGLERDPAYAPDAAALAEFTGVYASEEAETTVTVEVRGGALAVLRRPDDMILLRPHSRDRFQARGGLGLVTFHRDAGRVVALGVTQDRVWDLRLRLVSSLP